MHTIYEPEFDSKNHTKFFEENDYTLFEEYRDVDVTLKRPHHDDKLNALSKRAFVLDYHLETGLDCSAIKKMSIIGVN